MQVPRLSECWGENEYVRQVGDGQAKVMGKDFYGRANWRAQTQSFRQDTGLEDYHPSLLWRQETAPRHGAAELGVSSGSSEAQQGWGG